MNDDSHMDSTPVLVVRNLRVAYGDKEVLHGVNLEIHQGEIYTLVGASGSGKSTFLSTLLGLYAQHEHIVDGSITMLGEDVRSLQSRDWRRLRRTQLGYVPQDPMTNLNPSMRVGDQIADALKAGGLTKRSAIKRTVLSLMTEVGIDEPERRIHQFPHEFSGGMCQRILIAIALSRNPSLIIADEPTSALDVTVQKTILDHMTKLVKDRGATLLFITHNIALAVERSDYIAVMHDGTLVETGTPHDIVLKPEDAYTKELISAAPGMLSSDDRCESSIPQDPADPALVVDDIVKHFRVRGTRKDLVASNHVSFTIPRGTTTALVGESGSGKTTLARMILGLEAPTTGRIIANGILLDPGDAEVMHHIRTFVQPVFQNPYASLDPMYTIAQTIREPLDILGGMAAEERDRRVLQLLDDVGMPRSCAIGYPSQLSGGQRQRIAIARALAIEPKILILDEAISALDVLVQKQILALLHHLQRNHGLTYLFITHDLAVARQFATNVVVLRHGIVEEQGEINAVFDHPRAEYTRELLNAIPRSFLSEEPPTRSDETPAS